MIWSRGCSPFDHVDFRASRLKKPTGVGTIGSTGRRAPKIHTGAEGTESPLRVTDASTILPALTHVAFNRHTSWR